MKLVIDDKIPYIRSYVERYGACVFLPGKDITATDVADADVLIVRTRTAVDERLLAGSRVRLVLTATIGYDHLDIDYLYKAGITWHNCPGCNARSVAQYIGSVLPPVIPGMTLGLVGCGHVGKEVKALAESLGWRVLVSDPPLGLNDDITACDVITYHVPLTFDGPYPTYHMAGDDFFRSLTRHPLIINCARGGVVDEKALLRAMDNGYVSDCVIDCWEEEPHISTELLRRARIATPHIAGYSANGKATASWMVLQALQEWCRLEGYDIPFDITQQSPLDILTEALGGTLPSLPPYDARRDSDALKAAPEQFEWYRGHYPLRLEEILD